MEYVLTHGTKDPPKPGGQNHFGYTRGERKARWQLAYFRAKYPDMEIYIWCRKYEPGLENKKKWQRVEDNADTSGHSRNYPCFSVPPDQWPSDEHVAKTIRDRQGYCGPPFKQSTKKENGND